MRFVASEHHRGHDPATEVDAGEVVGIYECVARGDSIWTALDAAPGYESVPVVEHGLDPIRAVHDADLVRFLSTAWEELAAVMAQRGQDRRQVIADLFPNPRYRDGMGEWREPDNAVARLGYWSFETATPMLAGTWSAARAAVDVALTATDLVLAGDRAAYGLCRPPGHHAASAMFGGYCYLNNAAIAADAAATTTGSRVAVLDVDYHHGNGTQQIFYGRSDVLYASVHADPAFAFPAFSGFADETGTGRGLGATVNVPLPHDCDEARYLDGLEVALETIERFAPDLLVLSLGVDTYELDPIAGLGLTTESFAKLGRRLAADGRPTVILQEGGYHLDHLARNVLAVLDGFGG